MPASDPLIRLLLWVSHLTLPQFSRDTSFNLPSNSLPVVTITKKLTIPLYLNGTDLRKQTDDRSLLVNAQANLQLPFCHRDNLKRC